MLAALSRLAILVRALARGQRGATMVEYAVMLAFIAAACVVLITSLGSATSSQYSNLNVLY